MQNVLRHYIFEKEIIKSVLFIRIIGILTFLFLISLGAFIYFPLPFTPVPITMQTLFVLLCGAFLNKKDGVMAQTIYLGLGAAGVPIFSLAQGGLLKLFGPTGGYLIGFVLATIVIANSMKFFEEKGELSFVHVLFVMSLGILSIYFCGALWLGLFLKFSLKNVFILGILPFIPGAISWYIFSGI